jgi:uncharacterized membrane protein
MNPLKPNLRTEWLPVLLILLSIGLASYFYINFPSHVPAHWNFRGNIDGYTSRIFGAWFLPILMTALYTILLLLPQIDPKNNRYHEFREAYHAIKNIIISFLFILYIFLGLSGLGYVLSFDIIVPIMIGILFIGIGYYSKDIKQNWTMGVRTPWTLESVKVWDKTNRLMSKLMVVCGIFIAVAALPLSDWLRLALIILPVASLIVVPLAYSYAIFQDEKIKKAKD